VKRDMGLVRDILLYAAEKPNTLVSDELTFGNHSRELVKYHIKILVQAGLLDGEDSWMTDPIHSHRCGIGNLTWLGNEFVDSAKDSSIWNIAMEKIGKPAVSYSFSIIFEWLKAEANRRLFPTP